MNWNKPALAFPIFMAALWADPAGASSDYGCEALWKLANPDTPCVSSAILSPGNDTRVNLLYLVQEGRGEFLPHQADPEPDIWSYASNDGYGKTFFDWNNFRAQFYDRTENEEYPEFFGTRCASFDSGTQAFLDGLKSAKGIRASEQAVLGDTRSAMRSTCEAGQKRSYRSNHAEEAPANIAWPENIQTRAGKEFLAYLVASHAFYDEDWTVARETFSQLRDANNKWVAETASYLLGRSELNAAQATAFDKWGFYSGPEGADKPSLARAREAFANYVKQYPSGLYVASAHGLHRRLLWVSGDVKGLGQAYAALLDKADISSETTAYLVEEIDTKLYEPTPSFDRIQDPLLLATLDLQAMRSTWGNSQAPLSREALEAQAPMFTGREDLFNFLRANHAFYVTNNPAEVLQHIPDAARQKAFSPLQFSRQMLRGQALASLNDPNEEGFWLEMLPGTVFNFQQRNMVELALAMNWERAGRVDKVFADSSPIKDDMTRSILLRQVAGPDILRKIVKDDGESQFVREVAFNTLLLKDLNRGHYSDFLKDRTLLPADLRQGWSQNPASASQLTSFFNPVKSSTRTCPDLPVTVEQLSKNAQAPLALLCLGEFYRNNGFDYLYYSGASPSDQLGGGKSQFPGGKISRQHLYQMVLAQKNTDPDARAYALYRAVWCYARTGNNGCGGEAVPQSQRKAWFTELKTKYANSKWAKDLDYYW
ncbi:MAG: hypothetical protein ACK5NN_07915 [Sphingomonadaceae bacterium]